MSNVISIEQYYERKTNELAQCYLKVKDSCFGKILEDELRSMGLKLANYQVYAAQERRKNDERKD